MVSFQKKFFLIRFIEGLLFLQKMETSYLETDYLSWKGDLVQLLFYRVGTYIGFDMDWFPSEKNPGLPFQITLK